MLQMLPLLCLCTLLLCRADLLGDAVHGASHAAEATARTTVKGTEDTARAADKSAHQVTGCVEHGAKDGLGSAVGCAASDTAKDSASAAKDAADDSVKRAKRDAKRVSVGGHMTMKVAKYAVRRLAEGGYSDPTGFDRDDNAKTAVKEQVAKMANKGKDEVDVQLDESPMSGQDPFAQGLPGRRLSVSAGLVAVDYSVSCQNKTEAEAIKDVLSSYDLKTANAELAELLQHHNSFSYVVLISDHSVHKSLAVEEPETPEIQLWQWVIGGAMLAVLLGCAARVANKLFLQGNSGEIKRSAVLTEEPDKDLESEEE
mmetsp:Transcript_28300/g.51084  ORF Transcript_28300/g.51084 Transcript_28300/m.51084 type:complete len:314 (-) Transcript_28300:137-1078(-)